MVEGENESEESTEEAPMEVEVIEVTTEAPIVEAPSDDLEAFLSSGDRSLEILFGSQSGNSEALATKFAKQAKSYGLEANVHDMDGFDFNSLEDKKRVLIICSTWGEGEQPDNAEDLWNFANSNEASRLEGVHFAVCALGDTSYAVSYTHLTLPTKRIV